MRPTASFSLQVEPPRLTPPRVSILLSTGATPDERGLRTSRQTT